jgi:hypothetical protein
MTSFSGRRWLARAGLLVASLIVLSACGADRSPTPAQVRPSFSDDEIVRTLSTRQLNAILSDDGALPVTLLEFVARWNEQAEANPEVQLVITTFQEADAAGHVTYELFEYLRLEGVVNDDGTLRSMALVDQTTFIDPAEVFRSNRGDAMAFMPLRAAFARYFFGRAVDPDLSPEAQGRLIVDVIGTDDPEVLSTFGDDPVDTSKAVNGILYRFASDRSGNVWFIARTHDGSPTTGG